MKHSSVATLYRAAKRIFSKLYAETARDKLKYHILIYIIDKKSYSLFLHSSIHIIIIPCTHCTKWRGGKSYRSNTPPPQSASNYLLLLLLLWFTRRFGSWWLHGRLRFGVSPFGRSGKISFEAADRYRYSLTTSRISWNFCWDSFSNNCEIGQPKEESFPDWMNAETAREKLKYHIFIYHIIIIDTNIMNTARYDDKWPGESSVSPLAPKRHSLTPPQLVDRFNFTHSLVVIIIGDRFRMSHFGRSEKKKNRSTALLPLSSLLGGCVVYHIFFVYIAPPPRRYHGWQCNMYFLWFFSASSLRNTMIIVSYYRGTGREWVGRISKPNHRQTVPANVRSGRDRKMPIDILSSSSGVSSLQDSQFIARGSQ